MFSYFLSGLKKEQLAKGESIDRELLRACGLADVLSDVTKTPAHAAVFNVEKGPDGKAGCVLQPVSKHRGPPAVQFDHVLQKWELRQPEVTAGPWLGWLAAEKASAMDLERWQLIGGATVTAGGNEWVCPIASASHQGFQFGTLPQSFTFAPDGEVIEHLLPAWQWLHDLAGELRALYAADAAGQRKLTIGELAKAAAQLLGVNYRVGLPELNWLHERGLAVLSQQTIHAICQSAFGFESLNQESVG